MDWITTWIYANHFNMFSLIDLFIYSFYYVCVTFVYTRNVLPMASPWSTRPRHLCSLCASYDCCWSLQPGPTILQRLVPWGMSSNSGDHRWLSCASLMSNNYWHLLTIHLCFWTNYSFIGVPDFDPHPCPCRWLRRRVPFVFKALVVAEILQPPQ